uniref:RNase H type-1 domain-containing protein n=1 Tax=Nicotiana tabacum TaxID=4097 RepID=A0A1S3XN92_TOBAC|nr:PREDICTED: uncharacterized protein LOC107766987 [Nicotiana tabacum]
MKRNPEKCAFDVTSGKFLGFLVSQRGIEVNPNQIKAIEGIPEHLTTKKQVQRLTGHIAALSRFISQSSDICHTFFGILRKENGLQWTAECAQALKELKAYLSSLPLLSKAEPGECLLAVSEVAMSAVHVQEDKGTFHIKEQRLQEYQAEICKLLSEFDEYQLDRIPRAQNIEADGLAKLAADTKSITGERNDGVLPDDKKEAKKIRMQAAMYNIIHYDLYKRTYGVLEEVHEGHCGAHSGS